MIDLQKIMTSFQGKGARSSIQRHLIVGLAVVLLLAGGEENARMGIAGAKWRESG